MQIISKDKLHQRWICKRCKKRQDEILQKAVLAL
jgi:transposase-like protein